MLAQGTPLHMVSEVLEHASIVVTKDVYGHLLERDKRTAAESMSRARLGGRIRVRGSQRGSQRDQKDPNRTGLGASDVGALRGTRTSNLLIRRLCRADRLPAHFAGDLPRCCSLMRSRQQR